jgi:hypothetical protein
VASILLLIIHLIFFTAPHSSKFSRLKEKSTNKNLDTFTSQDNQFIIEDLEDTQDKEFYRLQKEKIDRKSAGLEPTRSDDVNIEVNDNQPTKSNAAISNTASNANINNEKEDDDTNYNKIMEKAGEDEQNLIVEKFYNVDHERFSDFNVSNEQRDTIKEIEAKLYEYQEKSNFTYINMIPRTLDDIILREQKTFGYMNRNFVLMLFLLFFNNFIKENLIIFSSYYVLLQVYKGGEVTNEDNTNYLKDIKIIGLLISAELFLQLISILFIMPFFKINIIFKKNLMIFMITSIVLMIPMSIFDLIYVYIPITCLVITIHKIIEYYCSCYLVYLIPPQWKYAHIRASSLPIYTMTMGKFLSCFLCFTYFERNTLNLNNYILTLISLSAYGIIGMIIYKSTNFRVKALARILRKKATE